MKTVQYSEKKLITYEEIQIISLLNFRLKQKIKLPHTVITHIETFVSNTSKYQWKIAQCVLISAELSDYQFIFCTQKKSKKRKKRWSYTDFFYIDSKVFRWWARKVAIPNYETCSNVNKECKIFCLKNWWKWFITLHSCKLWKQENKGSMVGQENQRNAMNNW